jgi:hypothetical protein
MTFIKSFLAALIGSVVANLILLFVLKPFVINPAMPLHSLSVMPVAMLTTIGVIIATIVYAIMRAIMARPQKAFIDISVIVLLLSFIPDYLIIGQTTGPFVGATLTSALTLMLMHIIAAVIIVLSLVKIWGARTPKVTQ